ncbi:unnamed protein product, partial [Staurois parvus]
MMSGSYILLTTIHVITDWPISDHMNGTSHRGPVQRSVFCCVRRTHRAPHRGAARSQGACTGRECGRTFINGHRSCTAPVRPFMY